MALAVKELRAERVRARARVGKTQGEHRHRLGKHERKRKRRSRTIRMTREDRSDEHDKVLRTQLCVHELHEDAHHTMSYRWCAMAPPAF